MGLRMQEAVQQQTVHSKELQAVFDILHQSQQTDSTEAHSLSEKVSPQVCDPFHCTIQTQMGTSKAVVSMI